MHQNSGPTKGDQFKLDRLLDFSRDTLEDHRVLGALSLEELFTWVDTSFVVHPNMRSHTGSTMSHLAVKFSVPPGI